MGSEVWVWAPSWRQLRWEGFLCHPALTIYFVYPPLGCTRSFCREPGPLTAGGKNLAKHMSTLPKCPSTAPEEHYHHPRGLSECRLLLPRLSLCVTQELGPSPGVCVFLSPLLETTDLALLFNVQIRAQAQRGMDGDLPRCFHGGVSPDPALVIFSPDL